ncbi:BZ3500_MvSof-1268-A1-R1_Chr4-1g06665 [Microbotryum saponariae]|uniref:BZ3500_MvSof-1268-A1-R1_Chr4-1g06665 protein n=1 Tax=Microbotryum saponariae TaxID=289078 RepID=A0A2X0KS92_9BASI|nr:BZ3500_MvSof-1268-A1-R1_Chr4-1g06665 [Microbotryum saponariae]SDA06330.1 BZ3501_MvSof-1269-A2-R1_Chr4-1g06375 [Microbotryum saponariae]
MRSLQLLSVLVTTCLPAAFAEIINNTGPAQVITQSSANISGVYTIQNGAGEFMAFHRDGAPGHSQVGISFQPEYATVNLTYRTAYGHSGRMLGTFSGVSICGENKCAATQFDEGRDSVVVPYTGAFHDDKHHTAVKMIFSVLTCGHSNDALSLAQRIGGASQKEDFKFKKANSKSAPSQKSSGKSGANTHHHFKSQRSNPGHLSRHHGGYRGKRHRGRTGNRGHGGRRGGRRDHGGHGGHGHKGGNHHGGGRSQHHHVRSLCPGNSLACQRRRHHLAKRDSRGPMSVSPQGPVPTQGPSSPSGVAATGGGTPKQSASGASGRAGSAAGHHGPGLQSEAKKTQEGAGSQQASRDPDPASGEDRSNSDIAEALKLDLLSGKSRKVCLVGLDHLKDMKTAGLTAKETTGFGGAPGLAYELFYPQQEIFWFDVKKVTD